MLWASHAGDREAVMLAGDLQGYTEQWERAGGGEGNRANPGCSGELNLGLPIAKWLLCYV